MHDAASDLVENFTGQALARGKQLALLESNVVAQTLGKGLRSQTIPCTSRFDISAKEGVIRQSPLHECCFAGALERGQQHLFLHAKVRVELCIEPPTEGDAIFPRPRPWTIEDRARHHERLVMLRREPAKPRITLHRS